MLKLSERRRRRQAEKLGATFRQLVDRMRAFGEAAGRFAATHRQPGQVYTEAQMEAMASAMVDEAKGSINAPLAALRTAGVTVDVGVDETSMRSAFVEGFRTGVGPDGMAPPRSGEDGSAAAFGAFLADVMVRGCQPGRLYSSAEIDKATEDACAFHERPRPAEDYADGVPPDIADAAAALGPAAFRAAVRRSLCAALPASFIAADGAA